MQSPWLWVARRRCKARQLAYLHKFLGVNGLVAEIACALSLADDVADGVVHGVSFFYKIVEIKPLQGFFFHFFLQKSGVLPHEVVCFFVAVACFKALQGCNKTVVALFRSFKCGYEKHWNSECYGYMENACGEPRFFAEKRDRGVALSVGKTVAVGDNYLASRKGVLYVEYVRKVVADTYYIYMEITFIERCKTLVYNCFAFVAPENDVYRLAAVLHGGGCHLEIAYMCACHYKSFVGKG